MRITDCASVRTGTWQQVGSPCGSHRSGPGSISASSAEVCSMRSVAAAASATATAFEGACCSNCAGCHAPDSSEREREILESVGAVGLGRHASKLVCWI